MVTLYLAICLRRGALLIFCHANALSHQITSDVVANGLTWWSDYLIMWLPHWTKIVILVHEWITSLDQFYDCQISSFFTTYDLLIWFKERAVQEQRAEAVGVVIREPEIKWSMENPWRGCKSCEPYHLHCPSVPVLHNSRHSFVDCTKISEFKCFSQYSFHTDITLWFLPGVLPIKVAPVHSPEKLYHEFEAQALYCWFIKPFYIYTWSKTSLSQDAMNEGE